MTDKQRGVASLLITSGLLLITLVLTLISYRGTFFQIKRAQNVLQERQEHWIAEGGLECVYGLAKLFSKVPEGSSETCGLPSSLTLTIPAVVNGSSRVLSSYQGADLSKKITEEAAQSLKAAITTSAELQFDGDLVVTEPHVGPLVFIDGDKEGQEEGAWKFWQEFNEYEPKGDTAFLCTVMRYKKAWKHVPTTVTNWAGARSTAVTNQGMASFARTMPDGKYYRTGGVGCKHTTVDGSDGQACLVEKDGKQIDKCSDWEKDPNLSPFEETFGVPASQHDQVKNSGSFEVLEGASTAYGFKFLQDCAKKIHGLVKAGHRHIWVEGGCELDNIYTNQITTHLTGQHNPTLTLVVHNGPLGVRGADNFKGVLVHFNDADYKPLPSHWDLFSREIREGLYPPGATAEQIAAVANTSFYANGSFTIQGALVFDASDQRANYTASLTVGYNAKYVNQALEPFKVIKWLDGSWNDFAQ